MERWRERCGREEEKCEGRRSTLLELSQLANGGGQEWGGAALLSASRLW